MKLFLMLLATCWFAQAFAQHPAIIAKVHLDGTSSSSIINKARAFMIHNGHGDPFSLGLEKPLSVELSQALEQLPDSTLNWIKEFQKLLQVKVFDSTFNLRVDGLRYDVKSFTSDIMPAATFQRMEFVTENKVSGLSIRADRLVFEVELKRTSSGAPINFEIEVVEPVLYVEDQDYLQVPMLWSALVNEKGIEFGVHQVDLTHIIKELARNPKFVDFEIKDFKMPNVAIKVGNKTLKLEKEKIRAFLLKESEGFRDTVINLLNINVDARFSNILAGNSVTFSIPKTFHVADEIHAVFGLNKMKGNYQSPIMEFEIGAHFCDQEQRALDPHCKEKPIVTQSRRKLTEGDFAQSMKAVDELLEKRHASMAFSVSEEYLNELIEAADQAGVLNLNGQDFKLGPQRAFVLADKVGTGFSLYLDIIYTLSSRDQILTGKKQLRFPVKLMVGVRIYNNDQEIPYLDITVLNVDTDKKMLQDGIKKYGLVSNVNSARFKKKVLSQIQKEIGRLKDQVLVDLSLNLFKNMKLDAAQFSSDGHGRGMATLMLDGEKFAQ